MRTKKGIRTIFILAVMGCFVSAQQSRAESVFQATQPRLLESLVLRPFCPDTGTSGTGIRLLEMSMSADTIETIDIEVEEEHGHNRYKELAVVAIVAAVVTYAVITLMRPGDEETKPETPGKPIPLEPFGIGISVPFNR